MRRKKEGYALVFTLIVIMLLVVLSTAIASLSTASYVNTISIEKNNKLKLAAESGVNRAQVAIRSYIKSNPDVIVNPNTFNPSQVSVDALNENGITTTVTISPNTGEPSTIVDNITGRNIRYINIHSEAKDNKTNKTRIVDTIIDKESVSNEYFDRLFKGSFTVAHKNGDVSPNSFVANSNTFLNASGTMNIQADNFQFQPQVPGNVTGSFGMDEGDIFVKKDTPIAYNIFPISSGKTINLFKDDKASDKTGWQSISIKPISLLNIIDKATSVEADDTQVFTNPLSESVDDAKIFYKQYTDEAGISQPITLLTYKARNASASANINFQKLINGLDNSGNNDGIYNNIIEDVLKVYPDIPGYPPNYVKDHYLDWYGHIYKVLLVDGDLDIEDDSNHNYNNYVIYCTGKVTFKGNANFFNSSIFSKSIQFPASDSGNKSIVFYGVRTDLAAQHSIGGQGLVDFNDNDKAIINNYLIKNLENYGDYMQFKTLSWKEQ